MKYQYEELSEADVESIKVIFRKHKASLEPFRNEIAAAAHTAAIDRGWVDDSQREAPKVARKVTKKEGIGMEEQKIIRNAPDAEGSRTSQVYNGFKFGFKKGVVNNGSMAIAKKMASFSSTFEDSEVMQRFVQVCILLGTAEMVDRMPESLAEKAHMSEEFRLDAASLCRYISGENLGRDAVDFAANILPLFKEVLSNISAEELTSFQEELEEDAEEFEESLFSGVEETVEETVKETVEETVNA